jgi:hypothetical protein
MPRIDSFSATPDELNCGDRIEIKAQVSFDGDARDITLICEIGPSCTFSSGARRVSMRRFGNSPQSFRFVEKIRCAPSPTPHLEQIQVIATDILEAADQTSHRLIVHC